jgi:hypothetical protein
MEQLELPVEATWDERRLWFEERQAEAARAGAPKPSEQACALMIDLQAVYCVGAWASAIVLAAVIVESQAREAGNLPAVVFPRIAPRDLTWLYQLRNRLVHERRDDPAITVEDQWLRRDRWQGHAERAIGLAFMALYPEKEAPP